MQLAIADMTIGYWHSYDQKWLHTLNISYKKKKKAVVKPLQIILLINIRYALESSECACVYFVVLSENGPGIRFSACLSAWAHALSCADAGLSGPETKHSSTVPWATWCALLLCCYVFTGLDQRPTSPYPEQSVCSWSQHHSSCTPALRAELAPTTSTQLRACKSCYPSPSLTFTVGFI